MKNKIYVLLFCAAMSLSLSAQTYHNGTWYSLYDDSEHTMNTQGDYSTGGIFAPTAGKLNTTWKYEWVDWLGFSRKVNTEVLESADNGSTTIIVGMLAENTNKNQITSESFNVSANINWIKFNRPNGFDLGGPTHKVIMQHIDIPLAKHILLAEGEYGKTTDSHNFDTIEVDAVSEAYTVNLRSFYTDGDIFITSSDPQNFRIGDVANTEGLTYEVGANACASANGKATAAQGGTLGKISNYDFPIYFTPKKGGDFEATITITDGTSTATVTVTGVAPKQEQTITWNEEQTTLFTNGTIATATASSGLDVAYTFAPEGVVSYADGAFQILSAGVVKITASQPGDDIYYAATPISKTFTIYPTETGSVYSASICEGSFYSDENFEHLTEAGVYTDTLKTTYGADSIITFTLAVNPLFLSEEELSFTIGEQHSWQGIDLGEFPIGDTTLVEEYKSIYGCDSIYTLHLTVKPHIITYGADTIHACSGETVIYEGKAYRQSATDSVVLSGQNYAGGDSIVVLVVSFSQSFSVEAFLTITEGDAEEWQSVDLSTIGVGDTTLVAEYQTIYGCDSTYVLYLTVEEKTEEPGDEPKDEAIPFTDADQVGVQKILYQGNIYIRKGDELFDIRGIKVETKK